MAKIGPRPLVLFGPSGSGKSTLLKMLFRDFPDTFGFCISHTTRKPRSEEQDGVHYHFTDPDTMRRDIADGKFFEHAVFSGNMYGTSKSALESVQSQGKICVLDIDVQGVEQVRKTNLNPWYVFLKPPSLQVLESRLRARNTESEKSLLQRLKSAADELDYGSVPGNFDLIVINDNLEHAYQQLKEFIEEEVLVERDESI